MPRSQQACSRAGGAEIRRQAGKILSVATGMAVMAVPKMKRSSYKDQHLCRYFSHLEVRGKFLETQVRNVVAAEHQRQLGGVILEVLLKAYQEGRVREIASDSEAGAVQVKGCRTQQTARVRDIVDDFESGLVPLTALSSPPT